MGGVFSLTRLLEKFLLYVCVFMALLIIVLQREMLMLS